jgi:hypothetical protein
MTDPTMPYTNLIDASLQGWTPGYVGGNWSPAVYRIDGPDEKLPAQLLLGSPTLTRIASTIHG